MKAVINIISPSRSKIFLVWGGICATAICLGFYIFFIQQAVFSTVARTYLESEIRNLSANVNSLESDYIAKENGITLNASHSFGLEEVDGTEFLSRKSLGGVLSFNQ